MKPTLMKMLLGTAVVLFSATLGMAQTTPPAGSASPSASPPVTTLKTPSLVKKAKPAAPAKAAAKPKKPRSAESIACSKEADAKKLHGKERKNFRARCIRAKRKAAKASPAGNAVPAKKTAAPTVPPAASKKN